MKDLKCPRCGARDIPFSVACRVQVLVQVGAGNIDVMQSPAPPQVELEEDMDCTCTQCTYISSLADYIIE